MGIVDRLRSIYEQVKKIPGLPYEVYKKLKDKLNNIIDKVNNIDIDPKDIIRKVTNAFNNTIGKQFNRIQRGFNSQITKIQDHFESALDQVGATMTEIPNTIRDKFDDIKEWTSGMADNILNPIKSFASEQWSKILPWLVGIFATLMFPVYGPILMSLLRILF